MSAEPGDRPDPLDRLAGCAEDFCLAESADGYVCSEEPGHDGWHRAYLAQEDKLLDTWPEESL